MVSCRRRRRKPWCVTGAFPLLRPSFFFPCANLCYVWVGGGDAGEWVGQVAKGREVKRVGWGAPCFSQYTTLCIDEER